MAPGNNPVIGVRVACAGCSRPPQPPPPLRPPAPRRIMRRRKGPAGSRSESMLACCWATAEQWPVSLTTPSWQPSRPATSSAMPPASAAPTFATSVTSGASCVSGGPPAPLSRTLTRENRSYKGRQMKFAPTASTLRSRSRGVAICLPSEAGGTSQASTLRSRSRGVGVGLPSEGGGTSHASTLRSRSRGLVAALSEDGDTSHAFPTDEGAGEGDRPAAESSR